MKNSIIQIIIFLGILCFISLPIRADSFDLYHFDSQQQQQRFTQLTNELRCLVCQNESLADSNAGLAKDLRAQIYQQVIAGKDEETIRHYLLSRYGQFILFKPAFNRLTIVLWLFPLLLLMIGTGIFIVIQRRGRLAEQPPVREL